MKITLLQMLPLRYMVGEMIDEWEDRGVRVFVCRGVHKGKRVYKVYKLERRVAGAKRIRKAA